MKKKTKKKKQRDYTAEIKALTKKGIQEGQICPWGAIFLCEAILIQQLELSDFEDDDFDRIVKIIKEIKLGLFKS